MYYCKFLCFDLKIKTKPKCVIRISFILAQRPGFALNDSVNCRDKLSTTNGYPGSFAKAKKRIPAKVF